MNHHYCFLCQTRTNNYEKYTICFCNGRASGFVQREWFPTVHNGVNCIAFRAAQHDAFYAIDADCVAITKKVEWRLSQRWLQLVAESGTPLFVSPQPEVLGPEQMEALKKSFDIASKPQATCEPLDWMETRHPARWTLLGREVSFDWEHPEE